MNLDEYIKKFKNLRVDRASKKTKGSVAPHKPILLLSIIKLIEDKEISSNHIHITPELIATFKEYWELLANPQFTREIPLPFYFLSSDKFWRLIPNPGQDDSTLFAKPIKSLTALYSKVAYAEIDLALFKLLQTQQYRDDFRQVLLDSYLDYNKQKFITQIDYSQYIQDVSTKILEESFETYHKHLSQGNAHSKQKKRERKLIEEKEFMRTRLFPKIVLREYNYSCCISKLQIKQASLISQEAGMVEGCHIEPFYIRGNNSINNGISLTPTIHRAFDRGLISIDDQYRVIIANSFQENSKSPYNLQQFNRQEILLPKDTECYPSQQALKEHRLKHGFSK